VSDESKIIKPLLQLPVDLMGTTGALSGEIARAIKGEGFRGTNLLPEILNPNSTVHGGQGSSRTSVSEQAGVENPVGAFALDAITDPGLLLSGIGAVKRMSKTGNRYDTGKVHVEHERIEVPQRDNWLTRPDEPQQVKNASSMTKEEAMRKLRSENKDVIAKMTDEEFKNTIIKPNGHFATVESYTPNTHQSLKQNEYIDEFNNNLDELNSIINRNNTSGEPYEVIGLNSKGDLKIKSKYGISDMGVGITPGKFTGEVQDIPNTQYLRNELPGLEMQYTLPGVFNSKITPRGTKFYESLNEFLKGRQMGRVKTGFSSQTASSRGLWENAIRKGKAVGYYGQPNEIYGAMKTVIPAIGTAAAATQIPKERYGGVVYQKPYTTRR
jgi:hypothetical protein